MTTPISVSCDADGRPLLTVAQAVALAKLSLPEGRHNPEGMAILGALWEQGEDTHSLLARIIIEWAPMVEARGRTPAEADVLRTAMALYHTWRACQMAFGQASATGSAFHRRELAAARDGKAEAAAALDEAITALGEAEEAAADLPPFLLRRVNGGAA